MESANTTVAIDSGADAGDGRDVYFADAARLLMEKEKGSIGMLQRYFKIRFLTVQPALWINWRKRVS